MIEVISEPAGLVDDRTLQKIRDRLTSVEGQISQDEGVDFGVVTVAIVPDARMRELHARFFGDDSPTDVITFPGEDRTDEGTVEGDIAICLDVAGEQSAEAGHSVIDEIVYLGAHGLLHLCGWDDRRPEDRAAMLERQNELVSRLRVDTNPGTVR